MDAIVVHATDLSLLAGVDALLITDFQNDFTPGGALAVVGGDEIAAPINRLTERFGFVVATRDWHPPDHGSFVGADVDMDRWEGTDPPGIWPVHCVAETEGAELHPELDRSRVDVVLDKGQSPHSQGYSSFHGSGLADVLRARGVDRLYVTGLTTDYCVKNSVLDALREGFEVVVVEDAIRAVNVKEGDGDRALAEMRHAGAEVATSDEVLRALAKR
jgi:nicotinamidase/pyrazinamidase